MSDSPKPLRAGATEARKPPFPFVSWGILVISVAVHAAQLLAASQGTPRDPAAQLALILKFGALYTPAVRDGQWWRLITYAFAHGSLPHLAFNMLATYALGMPLERRIGTVRFAPLSLVACLGSAAVVIALPLGAARPTVGVSGVIFGWAGALLFLVSRAQMQELVRMLMLNALISLMPGVSWQGHLGGFLFGVACGLLLRADPQKFSVRVPILVGLAGALSLVAAYRR